MNTEDKIINGTLVVLGIMFVALVVLFILGATGVVKMKDSKDDVECIYIYQPTGVFVPVCTTHKKHK